MTTTVEIESVGHGGVGIARLEDGMTVFVPRTAPGDRVEIDIVERKPRWGRGRLRKVLEAGPGRVEPQCLHYTEDACGGCQLQHIDLETQLEIKRRIVGDALRRIGKFRVEDPQIEPAPSSTGYRRRMRFAARAGRSLGYRSFEDPDAGFVVASCPVADPGLMELWGDIRKRDLPLGDADEVSLRRDRNGGLHVLVDGSAPLVEQIRAAVHDRAQVSAGDDPAVASGAPPPGAFEQSNPELAAAIRVRAVDFLRPQAGEVCWDLYCGLGDTARALAPGGASIWAVDSDWSALEWAADEPAEGDIRFVAATVEDALAELPDPDAVVLNPPRSGLTKPVRRFLAEMLTARPAVRLAYVSCDPATLARDLKALAPIDIESVRAFDLFPHTSHVETLVCFRGQP